MTCGIYRIRNLKTDAVYYAKCDDVTSIAAKERFRLDLGMHQCAPLQKDYSETGLELFVIEVVCECSEDELDSRLDQELSRAITDGLKPYPAG